MAGHRGIFSVAVLAALVASADAADCKDDHEHCKFWAQDGECENNQGFMLMRCRLSCGACGVGDAQCMDKDPQCQKLTAKTGACQLNTSEMLNLCPKTCRICGPGDFCIADPNDRGAFAEPGALDRNFERIISDPSYQKYKPHVLSKDPWVVAFDNFLEDTEVDAVLDQFQTGWKRSQAGGLIGEDSVMEVRTSEQIWCDSKVCEKKAAMNKLVENIEKITGVPRNHYEDTQMLRYLKGQEYKHHLDWIQGQNTLACGPRLFTFFVYLNDSPDSGTFFSKLNITKPAKKGTAVMWVNVNTTDVWKPDKRVMHLGLPAVQTKFSANIWIHQYDFRNYNDKLCLLADRALEYIPVGGKKQKKEL